MNDLITWLIEHEYADSIHSAAGMANGLQLAGMLDGTNIQRVRLYRGWRPTHKSAVKAWQAFELVLKAPQINPADYPDRQMDLFQPVCGHLLTSVIQTDEGTAWCGECADDARYHGQGSAI